MTGKGYSIVITSSKISAMLIMRSSEIKQDVMGILQNLFPSMSVLIGGGNSKSIECLLFPPITGEMYCGL
jgi:hypothetical protein